MNVQPTTKEQADILWRMGVGVYYRTHHHPRWRALGYVYRQDGIGGPSAYPTLEWGVEVE